MGSSGAFEVDVVDEVPSAEAFPSSIDAVIAAAVSLASGDEGW